MTKRHVSTLPPIPADAPWPSYVHRQIIEAVERPDGAVVGLCPLCGKESDGWFERTETRTYGELVIVPPHPGCRRWQRANGGLLALRVVKR